MTDPQVFIFGSFTEDEIRSLQHGTQKNNEFTFGSLDPKTLRSVGIYNTRLSEFHTSKGCAFSNTARRQNEFSIPDTSILKENEFISGTCLDDSGARELKPSRIEQSVYSSFCVTCNSSNQSDLAHSVVQGVSNLSSPNGDVLDDSANDVRQLESEESISKASNGPVVIPTNFLPRGLVNLGNLCFLNATLQALLSCSPFFGLLHELKIRNIPEIEYPTLCSFVKFITEFDILTDSICKRNEKTVLEIGRPFRPIMFESVLKSFTPDIPDNLSGRPRQEDAQEFLSFVMHLVHDELLKLDGHSWYGNGKTPSLVSSTDIEGEDDNWETVGPRNRTANTRTQLFMPSKLSAIFGGQLRSVVRARGNKASATIQPFLLLHLNIFPEPVCTIEDALRLFSAPETLEGYRASTAEKAEVVTASKSIKILELSEIMILHLMRFSYGSLGSTKLHKAVHFPLELVIDRELLASASFEGKRYELVATITHHGRDPSKGHYTADVRHPKGKWLRYDDALVTPIHENKVLHSQAYVLFYKRI